MRTSQIAGIVLANTNDELLHQLTSNRSMASVPFGARYRLIDFSLSNLVNAGIDNVGLLTKGNYRSLLDHVGSGIYWDLDRKKGGLRLMPPYNISGAGRYSGNVEALYGATDFITRSNADLIVVCDGDTVANVDLSAPIEAHIERGADVTVITHHGIRPVNHKDSMILSCEADGKVTDISFKGDDVNEVDFSIGITIFDSRLLKKMIVRAYESDARNLNREVLKTELPRLNIYEWKHSGFAAVMDSERDYIAASMRLLDDDVRHDLFRRDRPVYTKTRDDMPTRYGTHSVMNNSIAADGCIIEGTVKNSILFRGVTVEAGAVVENCILMQGTKIGKNAAINHLITDKNVVIGQDVVFKGNPDQPFMIGKNQTL